ncbi:MAG: type II toxin-antitoxin system HicB family antitoxin [Gammaproteobacteria bacterium]|nr:type II toxin-antitoxin system HicB family antitoxin [Gammaproteobacteria bacterium]
MAINFTLDYWLDDGWYIGKLREVPGVFSQGKTLDDLKSNIRDAYALMMQETSDVPVKEFQSTKFPVETA